MANSHIFSWIFVLPFLAGETIFLSVLLEWVPLKACLCWVYLEDRALDVVVVQLLIPAYSLQPCDLQHARLPSPLPSPGVCSNSCPLSWWCHPTISFSIDPFSSYPQSFPPSGTFPLSWLFASGGQSTGALASASVLPMSIQGWFFFRIDWFDLLAVQGTLKSLLQHHSLKALVLWHSAFFVVHLLHQYMTTGKTITLTVWTFVGKVMSLLFNMLSRLVITFLPASKHLLISLLQSPSAVILEPRKNKACHCFHSFPIYLPWSDGTRCHDPSFLNVEL